MTNLTEKFRFCRESFGFSEVGINRISLAGFHYQCENCPLEYVMMTKLNKRESYIM